MKQKFILHHFHTQLFPCFGYIGSLAHHSGKLLKGFIKNGLEEDYGEIAVSVEDKTVELNLSEEKIEAFKSDMSDLGFEVVERLD